MRYRQFLLVILISLGLSACDYDMWVSDYDFETTAIYTAPKSNATATVLAKGFVPKGDDLGDWKQCLVIARITFSEKPNGKLKITSNGLAISAVEINSLNISVSDSSNYTAVLTDCAKQMGILKISDIEMKELGEAILSTGAGPKGTYLKGQTKAIVVDTVRYTTKDR
jgi:hypothetical protein